MKRDHKEFETLLKAKGIRKKAFSTYSGIPYDTVAGWKKSGRVPPYAMVLLVQMPSGREYVSAGELLKAGLPKAVLWNNDPDKKVPTDIFIVATLMRAHNDFVIDKLTEYFGKETVLAALLTHKEQISAHLARRVAEHIRRFPKSA